MGEFTATNGRGKTLAAALTDIFTVTNFGIALISALIGYMVFEYLRKKLYVSFFLLDRAPRTSVFFDGFRVMDRAQIHLTQENPHQHVFSESRSASYSPCRSTRSRGHWHLDTTRRSPAGQRTFCPGGG